MLKLSVRKCGPGFRGSIKWVVNKKVIWSESSQITRLTKEDALSDAQWLFDQHKPVI